MANTVKLKRSAVQGKAPVVGDLALGELAVNTYDGKLYTKKNDGSDAIVEIGAGSGSTNLSYTQSTNELASSSGTNVTLPLAGAAANEDGLMSHEDKAKLDGVATGAEVNAVDSVNGATGDVVLDTDDISEGSTNLYSQWDDVTGGINYASGNVGIGTTSPGQALDVVGAINSQNNATAIVHYQAQDTGAAANEKTWRVAQTNRTGKSLQLGLSVNDAASAAYAPITISRSGVSLDNIQFATGTGIERARIDSSGNVGIGDTGPDSILTVTGGAIRSKNVSGDTGFDFYENGSAALIRQRNNRPLLFYTNNDEAMRLDSDGRLLVGTSGSRGVGSATEAGFQLETNASQVAASYVINFAGPVGSIISLGKSRSSSIGGTTLVEEDDNLGEIRFAGADGVDTVSRAASITAQVDGTPGADNMPGRLVFSTTANGASSPTERMRMDSSGRLLVGTSTWTGSSSKIVCVGNTGNAAGTGLIAIGRGTALGSLVDTQNLGRLTFTANNGEEFARISSLVDGSPTSSSYPGNLTFSTTADGASSPTERMRIDSYGRVMFGTTSRTAVSLSGATFTPSTNGRMLFDVGTTSANTTQLQRFYNANGQVGSIATSSSTTSYNTSSDYRLKENVTAVSDGITRLQQLKPSRFNFIADPDKTVDGFLAHEVQDIVPEAVTGEKDAVDDEGNPEYQGIDQSKVVPLLTAALQEAVAKIEVLEQRLNDAGL